MADTPSNEGYLAKPPGPCCWAGFLHEGSPRGDVEDILDVPTYIVRPSNVKGSSSSNGNVVLYFPDAWGLSVNAKCLMDSFASAGYTVLGMDYDRRGSLPRNAETDPLPPGVDHMAWMINRWKFASENLSKWTIAVRERFSAELKEVTGQEARYACVGYCAGALFVSDLLAGVGGDGEPVVSAGAFAHPAALKEEQITGIKKPLLLSCAENDDVLPTETRRKTVDILQREQKIYHFQLFQGVGHGFASRGDMSDPYQRWCKEQSLRAIIDWFDMWLNHSS